MSGEEDPERLHQAGASPALRTLLAAGRSETPDEAQLLALAAKLGAAAAVGAGAAAAGSAGAGVSAGVKLGLAVKLFAAIAIVGAVGATATAITRLAPSEAPAVGLVTPPATMTASAATPLPVHEEEPLAAPVSDGKARPVPSAPKDEGAAAETKLLERAQIALRSQPAEALVLCNDHVRRFPAGTLTQEREVIAVEALVKLGRRDEARSRADRFEARFPGSSHTRRLEILLAP